MSVQRTLAPPRNDIPKSFRFKRTIQGIHVWVSRTRVFFDKPGHPYVIATPKLNQTLDDVETIMLKQLEAA